MLGGGIDVLINNAGITRPGRFESVRKTRINLFHILASILTLSPCFAAPKG